MFLAQKYKLATLLKCFVTPTGNGTAIWRCQRSCGEGLVACSAKGDLFFFSYLRPWVLVRPRESTISRPPALQSQTSRLPTELILPRWKVRLKYVNCPANVVYFPSANRFRNLKFVRVWREFWWRNSQSLFFALVNLLAGYFPLRPCERPLKPFEQSKFCSSACLLHAEVHFMYFITTKYLVYRIRSHCTKVSTSV